MISLTIDNKKIEVEEGTTILQAAKACGINIPTLCFLEHFKAEGICRVCVVEVENARTLVASCCTPVSEGMVVHTHSKRVRLSRRLTVELLVSEHDGDCKLCTRNDDCELQELARQMGIVDERFAGEHTASYIDNSTAALERDNGKCIKCRRCVDVCKGIEAVGAISAQGRGFSTVIGPAFGEDLDTVECIQCGQCSAVCPVGSISENSSIEDVWNALDDPEKYVVVQTAPAIRAALGEQFGYPPGTLVTGKMTAALRQMGFNNVFDTNFTADLTIMEEGTELLVRLKNALVEKQEVALPQFTSCCPGWINFAEIYFPQYLDNLSTCKSPQQMFGTILKTYYAEKAGVDPKNMVVVSVMPCTAKKYEAARDEMTDSGFQDVDYVLTTRELSRMIKQASLDFDVLEPEAMDSPFPESSGAADIFANTGGVMEAALRTAYEIVTGRELPMENLHVAPIAGLEGVKSLTVKIEGCVEDWNFLEGVDLKVMVVHSLANVRKMFSEDEWKSYHFIEVMTCPGGCISGGGQPRLTDDSVREKRIEAIYKEDEGKELRKSHDNPYVTKIYEEFLTQPLSEKSHHLLHTDYTPRNNKES